MLELKSHFSSEEVEGAQQWAKAARIEDVASAWATSDNSLRKTKYRQDPPENQSQNEEAPLGRAAQGTPAAFSVRGSSYQI